MEISKLIIFFKLEKINCYYVIFDSDLVEINFIRVNNICMSVVVIDC